MDCGRGGALQNIYLLRLFKARGFSRSRTPRGHPMLVSNKIMLSYF